jgi:ABC-type multidrug transport system ATPase subunit
MTVEEHLYFYCRIKDIKTDYAQTIESIVNMLKIQDEYKKKVRELSGGNKRKVSIAIAVLGNPEMMIFDEPTSGLDPLSRRAVW